MADAPASMPVAPKEPPRILVRAGMTALETPSVERILSENLIGLNTGNLVYQYSITRALMESPRQVFQADRYALSAKDAGWVQEHFDAYVIPLADTFRTDSIPELERLTGLVKALSMPCVVIGAGASIRKGMQVEEPHAFDDATRAFMDAVLEKSALVGIRGDVTARYLTYLGYTEGTHFQVIGCPSFYGCGAQLPRKPLDLRPESPISVNSNVYQPKGAIDFANKLLQRYPNAVYLPQRIKELQLLYLGTPYKDRPSAKNSYPRTLAAEPYAQDRVRMFTHAKPWIDFLSQCALSVGGRMHGNVAAVLAGTPVLFLPHDNRMRELVAFHQLPAVDAASVGEGTQLEDLLAQVDFNAMFACQGEHYRAYCAFLEKNGLRCALGEGEQGAPAPLDSMLGGMSLPGAVGSVVRAGAMEKAARWAKTAAARARYLATR